MSSNVSSKRIPASRRKWLLRALKLGLPGRLLVQRYFESGIDWEVVGNDTYYWTYFACFAYLRNHDCVPRRQEADTALVCAVEELEEYLLHEAMPPMLAKMSGLGRADGSCVPFLKEFWVSMEKPGWVEDTERQPEDYFDFIDSLRDVLATCIRERVDLSFRGGY